MPFPPSRSRARSTARSTAQSLFDVGVEAADPEATTLSALREHWETRGTEGWRFLALGKAAGKMLAGARAAARSAGISPIDTLAVTNVENAPKRPSAEVVTIYGGHPAPNPGSVEGATALLERARAAGEEERVLVLISGGGSALAALPVEGLTLADKIETTEALLASGADIHEMNTVRKHLSAFKGGGLAKACHRAPSLVLILSDVVGDDPSTIASGPMAADPTTYRQAWRVIEKYGLEEAVPTNVRRHLRKGVEGRIAETPKADDPMFSHVTTRIIGSNRQSLDGIEGFIDRPSIGLERIRHPEPIVGEARQAAAMLVKTYGDAPRPRVILGGGETTVAVTGGGKGGRNQEMALAFAIEAERAGWRNFVFLSGGTDGRDGPTDAAGGIVDDGSLERMRAKGIDPRSKLADNDSHPALGASGDLLTTAGTGTNVADLQVLILW